MTKNAALPAIAAPPLREQPYNLLAEQMVLGALLSNNDHLHKIDEYLAPDHFFEPVHQRIYASIRTVIERGMTASLVTLKNQFDKDEALKAYDGSMYLQQLLGLAATIINVQDYGRIIYDLYLRRKLVLLGEEVVNTAYDNEIESTATEQIEQAEHALFTLASEGSLDRHYQSLQTSMAAAIMHAEKAYKNKGGVSGISSGFKDLDTLLGGFQNSDLIILAGRPSMGKTAIAVNLALNACKALVETHQNSESPTGPPPSVGVFSLEMSAEQLATRIISIYSMVNSSKLRSGNLTEEDFANIVKASTSLQSMPLYIDDTPALTIGALRARARRLKRKHNLAFMVVDYLQLLRGSSASKDANRVQEVSEISQGLKAIAKELNIPIIAAAQLSRAVEQREDKRPHLSDIRESGSIEQDADIVIFIYREEYYIGRKRPAEGTDAHERWMESMDQVRNLTELIIAKHRNGPIGNVNLFFDSSTTLFKDHVNEHLSDLVYMPG